MLKSKKLPKEFWAEVVACAVYLSNRSPTRSLSGKTPQDAWSGRKLCISHLRVFGSVAHVHISDEKRAKLDEQSLMIKVRNSSLLVMIKAQRATSFTIQTTARL